MGREGSSCPERRLMSASRILTTIGSRGIHLAHSWSSWTLPTLTIVMLSGTARKRRYAHASRG
jgi:hypothetical protein